MDQFELLRATFVEKKLNSFSKISLVVFSFKRHKDSGRNVDAFGHSDDRVETRNFSFALDVSPKIGGYVSTFRSFFETEFCVLSELANALGELRSVFQGSMSSQHSGPNAAVKHSMAFVIANKELY
jgi:hypothetical protein